MRAAESKARFNKIHLEMTTEEMVFTLARKVRFIHHYIMCRRPLPSETIIQI